MKAEIVPYAGWEMCLRLANAEIELIATAQIGPRIIRLGFIGAENEFANYPEQVGQTGGDKWRNYGGHRLWHSPEVDGRTNIPDNHPVAWWQEGDWLTLQAQPEAATRIRKEISVRLDAAQNHARLMHKLTNTGPWAVELAPWAISVMAPGGRLIAPQEPFQAHEVRLQPVRPLVLWGYTNMVDPRFTWGQRYIQMSQDPTAPLPQKFGIWNSLGWAAYVNGDRVFVKRFACQAGAAYPDMGCNAEFYTNQRMLEAESLGPLTRLEPGASIVHQEDWYLFRGVQMGRTDEEIAACLEPLVQRTAG
jgi:hypothetical protein